MSVTVSTNVCSITKTTATDIDCVSSNSCCCGTFNYTTATASTAHVEAATASTSNY
jgi:hypothetical protein